MLYRLSYGGLPESGAEGDRTPDLRIANAALSQTELLPQGLGGTSSGARCVAYAQWAREDSNL